LDEGRSGVLQGAKADEFRTLRRDAVDERETANVATAYGIVIHF
jgi:hypothetical protein